MAQPIISIEMVGMPEALRLVEEFPFRVDRKLKNIFVRAAEFATEVCKENTPVAAEASSHDPMPGFLRDSNVPWSKGGNFTIDAGVANLAEYAAYVCLGTWKMPARDFMTPGYIYGRKWLFMELQALKASLKDNM